MRKALMIHLVVLLCLGTVPVHAANWLLENHWGGRGNGDGEFQDPRALAFGPNHHFYVADYGNARVQQFDSVGNFVRAWGALGETDVGFEYLKGITVDNSGFVYVLDGSHIEKFTADGQFLMKTDDETRVYGYSLAASPDNIVYTVGNSRIVGFDSQLMIVDGHDVTGCGEDTYGGIAIAGGHFYLTDSPCQSIDAYSDAGVRLGHWVIDGLLSCFSIAELNSQLFVTSPTEKAIRILDTGGNDMGSIPIPQLNDETLFPTAVAAHDDRIYVLAGDHVLEFSYQTAAQEASWSEMKDKYQ